MERTRRAIEVIDLHPHISSFRDDVVAGLRMLQRRIPPKYFYDRRGSELFEEITELPEYYLTRTEIAILRARAGEIASAVGSDVDLIEFGSGSSAKVRILLDRLEGSTTYMPVDISRGYLVDAASALSDDYPELRVVAVCADYTDLVLPPSSSSRPRLLFFPGSTVGNFEPAAAAAFFRQSSADLRPGDTMIVGVDLRKPTDLLDAAYNDSQGVTAAFNLNLLVRINRELGADFAVDHFDHVAFFDEDQGRIEMHLRSARDQTVRIAPEEFHFFAGETIHTENSYKYSIPDFHALLEGSRFRPLEVWTDQEEQFSVHLLRCQ
jgi:dimethylhistidine N-methyltransferase